MALDPLAPLRLGIRIGIGVLRFELRVVERVLGLDRPEPPLGAPQAPVDWEVRVEPEPAPPPPAAPPTAPSVQVPQPPLPPEPEAWPEPAPEPPAHIDTEPELVGEFAETGAEEGAGAELHVEEPWKGYRKMRVADLRERVAVAGPEELVVVQLYEATHENRRSVLDVVERRKKQLANAPARS
jgi:hypothetical protein